jgi:hypothetical protein
MNKQEFRKLSINVLDTQNGVNEDAYQVLLDNAAEFGSMDIMTQVQWVKNNDGTKSYFLPENHDIEQ